MGDLMNPSGPPFSFLPPGFRFLPTEEQLLTYYLNNKNNNFSFPSTPNHPSLGLDCIREVDLYNYDPCDLPEIAAFPFGHGGSKKHWYCFTVKASKGSKRKAKGGFWKRKGRSRDVLGGKEGGVLGRKSTFVFHRCNLSPAWRTNWVMIEYALVDQDRKDSFVLCRLFLKSCSRNKMVERVPPCAGESIAAVHNICINVPCKQHDGASTSRIGEVVVHEDTLVDTNNEIKMCPPESCCEPDNPILAGPISDNAFGSSVDIRQSDQVVNFSDGFIGNGDFVGDELITNPTIIEGDFIELDDLAPPLLGP